MAAPKKLRGKPQAGMVVPELGRTGLKQYGGYVREEFLKDLQGPQGMKIYREMGDNSAVIGSSIGQIKLIGSRVKWYVKPFRESEDAPAKPEDIARAQFFTQCMGDMTHTWPSLVRSGLSMIQYGFAPHEIVLKVRQGEQSNPVKSSKYADGLIGWARLPLRSQDSLQKWVFGPNGDTLGLWQYVIGISPPTLIPMSKVLNFRPRSDKDNPEGVSVLRYVYFTYYFAKQMQVSEGIGIERAIAGMPVMGIPAECMASGASAELAAVYDGAKEIVQNIRHDQDDGVVLPMAYKDGQPLYKFELLSANGSSLPDTSKIIERLERRISQAMGTDFMLLGHEGVGSYALGDSKTDSFELAVEGYLDLFAEPIQHQLFPLTMRLNGWPVERTPKLCHEPIEQRDLAKWGDFVNKMVSGKVITADDDVEAEARKIACLPPRNPALEPREPPGPTNTKPEGGSPDEPKPPETKPTGPQPRESDEDAEDIAAALEALADPAPAIPWEQVRAEMEAAHAREQAKDALALAKAAVERPQAPLTVQVGSPAVTVEAAPAPNVDVKVEPPAVSVTTPTPIVHNEISIRQSVSKKVAGFLRDVKDRIVGAEIEERVDSEIEEKE
jgi:hypothetical protein